jgi:hypothetical protein
VVKLYVEGGGDATVLKTACRQGFTQFITNAGLKNRPRVVACGNRRDAYESFCTAIDNGEDAMLLVDSEAAVSADHQKGDDRSKWLPWSHLEQRKGDGWTKPNGSADTDCHLMVQVMESWFLADRDILKTFFGNRFRENKLPAATRSIEDADKDEVYRALKDATDDCKTKSSYGKGEHSFKLLAKIDPAKILGASRWARRFIDELKVKLDA